MRKLFILFLCMVSALVFMSNSCGKDDEIAANPCDETQKPEISKSFVLSAYIYYKDNVPYEGPVHFKIKKEYCDGTISGEYYLSHIPTDAQGGWFSGMIYTYKFTNERDMVVVQFTWTTDSKDYWEWWQEWDYADVVNEADPMEITCQITLPYNSP
jgi:hypothetical protein